MPAAWRLALCCFLWTWPGVLLAQVLTLTQAQAVPLSAAITGATTVTLPHDWEQGFPGFSGLMEYRMRFDAPPPGALLGVYVQRACSNLEVWINGELVGSGGRMTPPVTRNCYYPHLFPLPRSLLRAHDNELRVRVAGHAADTVSARQRAAGLSAVEIGPMEQLQASFEQQRFWNITVAQIIATSVAGLGIAMVCLWMLRRRDVYLLYFGLFTAGWALISVRLFVRDVPLSHQAAEILICSVFPPVLACAYLFLLRLVDRRVRWFERLLWLQVLLAPAALLAAPASRLLPVATGVYDVVAVEFLGCALYFFRVSWRTHRRDFWLVGGLLLLAIGLVGVEIALQNDLLPLPKVHVIHFVMPVVFAVIGLRLIQLFVRALRDAEELNAQLENRVAQKSEEIARSWEQIARLRTAQAAQDERRRIAADLHDDLGAQLLSIAQASQRGGEPERIAGMARRAMDEMRLSVRGLTGDAALTADVLADWRAETVTRLAEAGFAVDWRADEPPPGTVLPARTQVQLTRILREAISNAVRHSGGGRCGVRVAFPPGAITLDIEDDGRGIDAAAGGTRRGLGLLNIERRVRGLGGQHRYSSRDGGGTRLSVRVPLAAGGVTT